MTSVGKKEYTIKINGVDVGITDVTGLVDVLGKVSTAIDAANKSNVSAAKASKESKAALTDEEKAAKKLAETQKKLAEVNSEANRVLLEEKLRLQEAQREQTRKAKLNVYEADSIRGMEVRLNDMREAYKKMTEAQREEADAAGVGAEAIKKLNDEYTAAKESLGQFQDNVGNYPDAMAKLGDGISGVTKTTQGLAQGLLGATSLLALFGNQSEEDAERAQKLQKVIALLSIAQQFNTKVLKQGIAEGKAASVLDALRITQAKAKTAAEAAATKGTVAATVVQKIFNAVASANPYVILALALIAVGTALVAFTSKTGDAAKEQKKLNAEIYRTGNAIAQINKDTDFEVAIAEAAGASAEELRKLRLEAAKTALAVADANNNMVSSNKNATKEMKEEALQMAKDAWDVYIGALNEITIAEVQARTDRRKKQKEALNNETADLRAAQDARLKLIENTDEQARKTLAIGYDRRIEDIKKRLATEENLTAKARAALNDQIESLEKQKAADLEKLQKEHATRALALTREVEDSRLALIIGGYERQQAEINTQYARQIEEYEKRLAEDKTLTEQQQTEITELILNAQKARGQALIKLTADQAQQRADLELSAIEDALEAQQNRIDEMTVRDKSGLKLIDVEATRENLAAANSVLDTYILDLQRYLGTLKSAHEKTLSTLQEGTPEYEAEQQKYARSVEEVTSRIKKAQKEQEKNTKASARVQIEALRDLFGKITEIASAAASVISQGMDTVNMALSAQIEDLNAQLDIIDDRYDAAKEQHQAAADHVGKLEAQMRAATGGTAEAIKAQLQDAMQARNEAARQEQQLARQKEKAEAELAKKEKQMKRADLIAKIAQGIANTALGVTQALGSAPPPINFVLAGLVGALGAVETALMSRQLAKLADGGEIKGPSHAAGGVPILINGRPAYEAQGGEFMVNDKSYGANKTLVQYINATPRTVTAADLVGIVPGGGTPVGVTDMSSSEDKILDAIGRIDFSPVVAVTEIEDRSQHVTEVRDLVGL